MKERPILFSGPMVRAILSGRKTQTRRVAKPGRDPSLLDGSWSDEYVLDPCNHGWLMRDCPYGEAGDRLWVREAFMHQPADYCWEASVSIPCRPAHTAYRADFPESRPGEGWKPSIHMPRNLSRITLEIIAVRVERLQDIGDADSLKEGINCYPFVPDDGFPVCDGYTHKQDDGEWVLWPTARAAYKALWEEINGPGSWDANPWVWVVEFRRIDNA